MSTKGLAVLAAVTAICVGLALKTLSEREMPLASTTLDTPLFPELVSRLDAIDSVRLERDGTTMTARRTDGRWTLAERWGYPADARKIDTLILGVANLRAMEAKTSLADKLPRLELEDPSTDEATSKRVTLMDGADETVASLVVGKQRYGAFGPGRAGSYVRRDGEMQSWLADRSLTLPATATDWLEPQIVDIPAETIESVELRSNGETAVRLARAGEDSGGLELESIPEGRLPDQGRIDQLAGFLSSLSLQDVRQASAALTGEITAEALFRTHEGLELRLRIDTDGEDDGKRYWARLEAGGNGADALSRRLGPWEFELLRYLADQLARSADDFLQAEDGSS